jgi:hypothetical protein
MGRFDYSEREQQINKVLKKHDADLSAIRQKLSEKKPSSIDAHTVPVRTITLRSWETIAAEADTQIPEKVELEDLFTATELASNEAYLLELRKKFDEMHRLDAIDYAIAGTAGIVSAAMDIFLVGLPVKTSMGITAGPLSNYIRDLFDQALPPEKIKALEGLAKVPYDAPHNAHTITWVEGLTPYFHRLLSLGHDPLLGFIVGMLDNMHGTMTTIDKNGKLVIQIIEGYTDKQETSMFRAIAKAFTHMRSDVNTAMGLPVPLMGLFNLFQFGTIGKEELTIAEIVQGMYYEGYDFRHFCSMSIPVMIIEVIVRLSYCIKRMNEGYSLKESLPISLNREKNPKLETMLWLAHVTSTGINAGKVVFTGNPLAINYPQWVTFITYTIQELKWILYEKAALRRNYVQGFIDREWETINATLEETWRMFTKDAFIVTAGSTKK